MIQRLMAASALLFSAAMTTPANAAMTIDTTGAANQYDFSCLGTDSSSCGQNFGQTFTTAVGASNLSSLTFYTQVDAGGSLALQMKVYAWNGSDTVGAALYTSSTRTITNSTFAAMTFAPNLQLNANQQYMALLTTVGLGNSDAQYAGQLISGNNNYSGGGFYFQLMAGDHNWYDAGGGDSSFKLTLDSVAAVPEPATWAMMVGGFGLIGVALRRRPRATSAGIAIA